MNDTIDFTSNDLRVLGNFPRLHRLKHLLLANNRISKIDAGLETPLPQLTTIILTNNTLEELGDIEPLATVSTLRHLVLLDNPVTKKEHYRLYVIYKLPSLRVLDFNKIKQKVKATRQIEKRDEGLIESFCLVGTRTSTGAIPIKGRPRQRPGTIHHG